MYMYVLETYSGVCQAHIHVHVYIIIYVLYNYNIIWTTLMLSQMREESKVRQIHLRGDKYDYNCQTQCVYMLMYM